MATKDVPDPNLRLKSVDEEGTMPTEGETPQHAEAEQIADTNIDELQQKLICRHCSKKVKENEKSIKCGICQFWLHTKCENVQPALLKCLRDTRNAQTHWFCKYCDHGAKKSVSDDVENFNGA